MQIRSSTDAGRTSLESQLECFVARVVTDDLAALASERCGKPVEETRLLLSIYANESYLGLRLIEPSIRVGARILEVGSGIGVLSGFLAESGYNVVAIEPSATGFSFISHVADAIRARLQVPSNGSPLPMGASSLDPQIHGRFDLIFSVNVLEHVADLEDAFHAMTAVLDRSGVMIHHCPNYTVPYEPHFGIPLIPMAPRLTRFVFPFVKKKHPGLWDSLNFITASRALRLARRNGLDISFDRGVMSDAMRRLEKDTLYRNRQAGSLVKIVSAFSALGGLPLIDAIPGRFASPMTMRLYRPAGCGLKPDRTRND